MADSRKVNGLRNHDKKIYSDLPPMSRLFIICSKLITEKDLRSSFKKFGEIEEICIVKNPETGFAKGVAYIKFSKTSEAAKALEEMHETCIVENTRPLRVFVASSRQEGERKFANHDGLQYLRLYVLIPKDTTDAKLRLDFGAFGTIDNITVIRDKVTKQCKGYGFVQFSNFVSAALACEGCDPKYKAAFAQPKPPRKDVSTRDVNVANKRSIESSERCKDESIKQLQTNEEEAYLTVIYSPLLNQDQLWRLFDIIPDMEYCQINKNPYCRDTTATVAYKTHVSAVYAKDKLNGLEYPPGERLIVKMGLDKTIPILPQIEELQGIDHDQLAFCSVPLPPVKPLAKIDSSCAQRCFVVCNPIPLPESVLTEVFCRVGDLIDVYLLPKKNCGYAKYVTKEAAFAAIRLFNGAVVLGVELRVFESEEPSKDVMKRMRLDSHKHYD